MDANKKSLTPWNFQGYPWLSSQSQRVSWRDIPYIINLPSGHWIDPPLKKSIQKFEIIDGYFIYLREQIYREWAKIKFSFFFF